MAGVFFWTALIYVISEKISLLKFWLIIINRECKMNFSLCDFLKDKFTKLLLVTNILLETENWSLLFFS